MSKISFIGVGNMAHAIINGILSHDGAFSADDIILYDKMKEKTEDYPSLAKAQSITEAVRCSDYIVFAVKPQNFAEVLGEIAESKTDITGKTFITIAAGITCDFITGYLPGAAVVRVMPNTPLLVGRGTTTLCRNSSVGTKEFETAFSLFSSLGYAAELDESQMNVIISLTSSSPAYIFLFIKALMDGAAEQGLSFDSPDTLKKLACEAVIGSAQLLMQSDKSAQQLIRDVTSPNGTTERAMNVLYSKDFENIIKEAMVRCTERAIELSGSK